MEDKPGVADSPMAVSPDNVSKELLVSSAAALDTNADKRLRWAFRKVDATLLLVLIGSNILNSMDRANLGLSKVAGLEADTGMRGSDFNVVVSMMYPTYLLGMLPSNLMLRKFGARIWLSLITVVWGVINMCMAFAKNRTDFILCRLFLGAAESGATPGALMLITLWYPREMVTSRVALFYSAFAAGAIIGGPIASGIMKIENPRFRSWEWIFFIEGLTTASFGLLMFFLLADYPEKSWLLKKNEKALLKQRMEQDQAEGGHRPVNRNRMWIHIRDPLIYSQALILFCANFGVNTILTFTAIIVNQMGYSPSAAQAMQAAPGICGFVGILLSRYYPKCSFGAIGIGPGWVMSNTGGPTRSAVSSALNVAHGGLGALCTSYIYRNQDAPRYLFGHGMNLFAGLLSVVMAIVARTIIRRRNMKKDTSPIDISRLTRDEVLDLENDHPDFRYVG
ncbi:hypothetical protein H4S02_001100 [Coemansia sp. RSA 2611]|nr:hypothetical protein H4S02_001100 [Coemansia sp. RSA 2611]